MIDVRMCNKKLVERGARFVSEICNISMEDAAKYLEQSGNKVKIACVMCLKQCSKEQAEQKLSECGGVLRKVI